jgi:hypothetical protein
MPTVADARAHVRNRPTSCSKATNRREPCPEGQRIQNTATTR